MAEPWADPPDLTPGRPRLEHVLFVLLGVVATVLALARMFAFL